MLGSLACVVRRAVGLLPSSRSRTSCAGVVCVTVVAVRVLETAAGRAAEDCCAVLFLASFAGLLRALSGLVVGARRRRSCVLPGVVSRRLGVTQAEKVLKVSFWRDAGRLKASFWSLLFNE